MPLVLLTILIFCVFHYTFFSKSHCCKSFSKKIRKCRHFMQPMNIQLRKLPGGKAAHTKISVKNYGE